MKSLFRALIISMLCLFLAGLLFVVAGVRRNHQPQVLLREELRNLAPVERAILPFGNVCETEGRHV